MWLSLSCPMCYITVIEMFSVLYGCVIEVSSMCSLPPQITEQQLRQTNDRFKAFLNGDTQIVADEAFINAVQSYYEVQ